MGRYGIDWDKGLEKFTIEDYDKIMVETTKIIRKRSIDACERALAFYDRGVLYEMREDYKKAIIDYSSAIHLRENFATYYNRGKMYAICRQYDKALFDLDKALSFNPDSEAAQNIIEIINRAKTAKEKADKNYFG